ncbi:hypothetical protein MCOR13_003427 [Pyricularia oryzae]|nr:hypothetical protein MCOR13_003427 [Pyricularia oryzae]
MSDNVTHSRMALPIAVAAPVVDRLPILTILVGSGLLYLVYRWLMPKPIPGIPYSPEHTRSIMGSLPSFLEFVKENQGRSKPWFPEQNVKLGSALVQIWETPFSRPSCVLTDFQEAQDILMRRTKDFDRGMRDSIVFQGTGKYHHISQTSQSPIFKANKALVKDLMSPRFLADVSAPEIHSKVQLLLRMWSKKTQLAKGKPFNARPDIIEAALDMINAAAFAYDEDSCSVSRQIRHLDSPDVRIDEKRDGSVDFSRAPDTEQAVVVHELGVYLGTQFVSPVPRLAHAFNYLTRPRLRRNLAKKEEIVFTEIRRALKRIEAGESTTASALEHLLRREMESARKAGREPNFFTPSVRDEGWGYIVAGHETSATAISWQVKLLADHPEVQTKLRAVLRAAYSDAAASNRLPTAREITSTPIPYLDAFLEEALRVRGPVLMTGREAKRDAYVLGHLVPKGTFVFMPSMGPTFHAPGIPIDDSVRSETSRTKSWGGSWDPEDVGSFRVERWLTRNPETGEDEYDVQSGPILAFGLGPRSCFGKRLAYLEMRIVIALLVWSFEFQKLPEHLSSYAAHDAITTGPTCCYVGLKELN